MKSLPNAQQASLTKVLLQLVASSSKKSSDPVLDKAIFVLAKLQKGNRVVLIECVKELCNSLVGTSHLNRNAQIIEMLVQRVEDYPTLSLETYRRLLASLDSKPSTNQSKTMFYLQVINLGIALKQNIGKVSNEH